MADDNPLARLRCPLSAAAESFAPFLHDPAATAIDRCRTAEPPPVRRLPFSPLYGVSPEIPSR